MQQLVFSTRVQMAGGGTWRQRPVILVMLRVSFAMQAQMWTEIIAP